jgi:hypothetical protein
MTDVDSEEAAESVEVLASLCVVHIGALTVINNWQPISLNASEASEVTPEVTLSEVLNLVRVRGVHV